MKRSISYTSALADQNFLMFVYPYLGNTFNLLTLLTVSVKSKHKQLSTTIINCLVALGITPEEIKTLLPHLIDRYDHVNVD